MPARQYYWYDTEDGEDMLKKLNFAAKMTIMFSMPVVILDSAAFQQQTMRGYGLRYLMYTVPALGMAGMFTFTSQMLCRHVPQVDPKWHYAVAGAAAGSVYGAARRSVYTGCLAGVYLGFAAFMARTIHESGEGSEFSSLPALHTFFNDDPFLAKDYSYDEPSNIILPAARPGNKNSELFN